VLDKVRFLTVTFFSVLYYIWDTFKKILILLITILILFLGYE
jgi:hypothetical protein